MNSSTTGAVTSRHGQVDVAILGGGLAANFVARHLTLALPQLRVSMFERETDRSWKVGESTVEIASDYMIRKLQLADYLYQYQLPKNGLRFFFDTPEKNTPFLDMSEVGSDKLPLLPTFQLDRARIERDLLAMNQAKGVTLWMPATVKHVELNETGGLHRVEVMHEGTLKTVSATYVIDCSGRGSPIARMKSLRRPIDHPMGAVWGRFSNIKPMDEIEAPEWRQRVRHTPRFLSTNHFCYPGYWIWFIPLGEGVTSVGWVGERENTFTTDMRKEEGFLKFLKKHTAVASLLEGSTCHDVMSYVQLAYGTTLFFSPHRWFLVGESAAFSDPFYSPGSDYISMESDMVVNMIKRELEGATESERIEQVGLYNEFMQFRFDATMLLYKDQYQALGSYDTMRLKWNFDIACYYNLWVDAFMRDKHLDMKELRIQMRRKDFILDALKEFSLLNQSLIQNLKSRKQFHRNNLGRYNNGTDMIGFVSEVGTPRTRREVNARTESIFKEIKQHALKLFDGTETPAERRLLSLMEQPMMDML